jgi:hypothetical protein
MPESKERNVVEVPEIISGGPTKRFFVSMLVRDIELDDAILDLIDNCVDGAMRVNPGKIASPDPFKNFEASITLKRNEFEISDNCGGIPSDQLEDAFSLGRPKLDKDRDIPTIGMYGIGMKRAIFKIARSATVSSVHADLSVSVEYSRDWLNPDNKEWDLPVTKINSQDLKKGVIIHSRDLLPDIGRHFSNEAFINKLRFKISEHFGYIIQKGFTIKLNGIPVRAATLPLRSSNFSAQPSIRAYDFHAKIGDVHVDVRIGFFRALVMEKEIDDETQSSTGREQAGISVICNDRVVLLHDRTIKTGWGDGGVPQFHPQFRAIAGLVIMASNNAEQLPLSTTKRDLDVGSEVFLQVRRACIEGIKIFTNFTNAWKGVEAEAAEFFDLAPQKDARREISLARDHGIAVRGLPNARKFRPVLPTPSSKTKRRISFIRELAEIEAVSMSLFGERDYSPSEVGAACFDRSLQEVKHG